MTNVAAHVDDPALERLRLAADLPDLRDTRYELVGEIARGGTGTVYEALDLELRRTVALKVVTLPETTSAAATRLDEEARRLARLEHAGIVPVHEMGMLRDGRAFYAMKLVRGKRLDEIILTTEPAEQLRVFSRVCDTVAYAHAHNVLHRDLKPQNVMIGAFGEVLVMDWSDVAGTPGFRAPEQVSAAALVDCRTDIYALGSMLRWMFYSSPGVVPRALAAIAAKATAFHPDDRYQSVESLVADVTAFVEQRRVKAYAEALPERAARFIGKYRTPVALVLAYLVLRVAFVLARR
jgi:serine/threonine protein kinase